MAFGPNGLGVMMPDLTGLTISRIASQLLNIFDRGDSPVRDVLIRCALNLESVTGDGLKTYFILLNSLFKNIRHYNDHIVFFNQIKRLQTALLHIEPPTSLSSQSVDIDQIITSFFYTRFTSPVALKLSHLFQEWIHANESISGDIFTFILENFDSLVYQQNNSFPLDESKVVEGITLSGHYIGEYSNGKERAVLKVMYFEEGNKNDTIDVDVRIMNLLKDMDGVTERVLLVVNNDIGGRGRHLLRLRRVNVLKLAETESTKLLAQYTQIYLSKHKTDPVVSFSCDLISHMTNVTIGVPVFQLKIYAPSKSYNKAYSTSLRGCLRLCRYTLDTRSYVIPAGQFERLFALYFASIFGSEDVIPVTDRQALEQWCEEKKRINEKLRNVSNSGEEEGSSVERIVMNLVLHLESSGLTLDIEVVRIICRSLMEIANKLPSKSLQPGFEPLSLKLAVLQATFTTLLMFINTDKILKCKKSQFSLAKDKLSELDLSSDSDSETN